ncbi:MAG: tetratricopeptide repeat protein [Oscillochloris sp.]|nr:tetratricopeptide repeat protein [Oscillochloris sp.]
MLAGINHPGHPNIPEIFHYLPDQRCLVMKYISGTSLSDLLQTAGALPLDEALRCVHAICSALVYLHEHRAQPVLHRDIKPANLMRDERGHYWLVDFGLAFAMPTGTQHNTIPLAKAGTPGYAPPEQWAGRAEPRSDVYALAMTLYTLVVGRLPAIEELDSRSGERRTIWIAAALPSGLPPQLVTLLDRTLARDAALRPTAAELHRELTALLEICTLADPPRPQLPAPPAVFVGREAESHTLAEQLATTPILLVHGPPGIGKRALVSQALWHMGQPENVWWFSCLPAIGDDQLIWSLVAFLGWHGLREPWAKLQIARQSGQAPPPPEHLLTLVIHALYAGQWTAPLLLVFDGFDHLIEQPLIRQLWQELCQLARPERLRLLVIVRRASAALAEYPSLALQGLTPETVTQLLASQGVRLEPTLANQLTAVTGGNPQLLRLAATVLRRADIANAQAIAQLAASNDIQRYLARQIDSALSDDERTVLQALAILGVAGGSRGAIAAVVASDIRIPLQTLLERGILREDDRSGRRVYLQPGLIGTFYLGQIEYQQHELHRRAADHYTRNEPDILVAAHHYSAAGSDDTAAALVATPFAVQQLIGEGRGRALAQLLASLPVLGLDPAREAAVAVARAETLILLGEYRPARRLLHDLLIGEASALEDVTPETRAYRWRLLARIESQAGAFDLAEQHCKRGLVALASAPAQETERARLYADLATALMRLGKTIEAAEACQAGINTLPRRPAAPRERAALLQRMATLAGTEGNYEQAIVALEQVLALARAVGDLVLIATTLHNLGTYRANRGERALALEAYRESLTIEEQAGNLAGQATTLDGMATRMMDLGDYAAAQSYFDAARALCERLGLREDLAWILGNLGQLYLIKGDLAAATEHLRQARTLHRKMNHPIGAADATYRLGDVALIAGDLDRAQTYGEEALALARQAASRAYESCALRVLGETALASGDTTAALRLLTAALASQRHVGDPYDTALILAAGARLAEARAEPDRALRRAQNALSFAHRAGVPHLITRLNTS